MNRRAAEPIVNAVLYEGYILYPYRPSIKNRQRWTFGGLYPEAYCRQDNGESCSNQTECLVHGSPETVFEAVIRFLHLSARQVGQIDPPLTEWPSVGEPPFRPVQTLRVGERLLHTWQEAEEREIALTNVTLADLVKHGRSKSFSFPCERNAEPVRSPDGRFAGILVRKQEAVQGAVQTSAVLVAPALYRVTLRVVNQTLQTEGLPSRDEALLGSFVSTHTLLGVRAGEFVSLIDPPDHWREAVAACRNVGTWPVLVGDDGEKDTMLSSPIILYDYPQVAPESPGDFFEGTEMDEMLTLRILTMTDEEKHAMAAVDARGSELLARTEAMARENLLALHGTVRGLRPVPEEGEHG